MRSLLVLALFVSPALADAPKPQAATTDAKQLHTDDCARAQAAHKQCVLDITGEEVDGAVITPSGSVLTGRIDPKQPSMIHLRREFISEIIKSAQGI
ncbi:MAG TPA: hypothetical protein VGC41_07180 [Kofleriaceae bacterium]